VFERVAFDTETNGLDWRAEGFKVHCLVLRDLDTDEVKWFYGDDIKIGINHLLNAKLIVGHFIQFFDLPMLEYVYQIKITTPRFDTKVMAGLMFPNINNHSLKEWGKRLDVLKDNFHETADWTVFTKKMLEYCKQDTKAAAAIFHHLMAQNWPTQSIELETRVADIISEQIQNGVEFNHEKAAETYLELLALREKLTSQLREAFKGWFADKGIFTPKKTTAARFYTADCPFSRIEWTEFNPASNDHIAYSLAKKYNWKPKILTPTGKAKVDEDVLSTLSYPEAKLLTEYATLKKVLGYIGEGKNAWLKCVKNGRIHGKINTTGTVTGRMSHYEPNLGQVPSSRSFMGKECRALFTASTGKVLVGCDAVGLEARGVAHYLYNYDNGFSCNLVNTADIHSHTASIIFKTDVITKEMRTVAKTVYFAFIYGARPKKIATLLDISLEKAMILYDTLACANPSLADFTNDVTRVAKRGWLKGLDGRKIMIGTNKWGRPDAPVNYLIQSAGALIMKQALIFAHNSLKDMVKFVLNVHDEFQVECLPDDAIYVGQTLANSITKAGEHFSLNCRLEGEFKIGSNWYETH
jgi:DNA polymerase-1